MTDSVLPGPIACAFATVFCIAAARYLHKRKANDFYVFLAAITGALFFMSAVAGGLHDKLICWFVAALFLAVAAQFMVKDKMPYAFTCLMVAAFFFCCGLTWVQIFLEHSLTQTVNTRLDDFAATIEQQRTELLGLGRTNQAQRIELVGLAKTNEMQAQTNAEFLRLLQGYADTNRDTLAQLKRQETTNMALQDAIVEQARKLTNVDMALNSLFTESRFESLNGADTNKVFILNKGAGLMVVFKLDCSPIMLSVHGMYSTPYTPPIPMYPLTFYDHNICGALFSGVSIEQLRSTTFSLEYVRNTTDTNMLKKVEIYDGKFYFDGGIVIESNRP